MTATASVPRTSHLDAKHVALTRTPPGTGCARETVNRCGGRGRGSVGANLIESIRAGIVRRGVIGVCRAMSAKHPQRCAAESRRSTRRPDAPLTRTPTPTRPTRPARPVLW